MRGPHPQSPISGGGEINKLLGEQPAGNPCQGLLDSLLCPICAARTVSQADHPLCSNELKSGALHLASLA